MERPGFDSRITAIAQVNFRNDQGESFLPAAGGAVALAAITVAAEIEHRPTGRKVTDLLVEDRGTSGAQPAWTLGQAAVDNRCRSWQDDSRRVRGRW